MLEITLNRVEELDRVVKESYKQLRTNLYFSGEDVQVILVTSTLEGEGKTTTSFNLSRELAEDGHRVLYIDADIRNSNTLKRFMPDKDVSGLSYLLAGRKSVNDVLCQTNIKNLFMIFSGDSAPNPAELLGNRKFESAIKAFREKFDYIIIDCPPLGSVTDASLIGRCADGALLVIEENRVGYKLARKSKEQLKRSGCRILGVVMNKMAVRKKDYYGKYYGKNKA